MPEPLVERFGTLLGTGFYALDAPHRRVAEQNVAAAFPARPEAERRQIVRAAFAHFGRLLFALLKFSTLSHERMLARVEFEGEERVRAAYAHGKGVLFVTGHFGFWELQAMVHALRLQPMAVLARALDNQRLNALLEGIRTRTGNSVIYRKGTIRRAMRLLLAGEGVGVLIDQHIMSRDAIYVDFFGRPAATTSAVAALALRTGARVVPLFALPLGDGRYRMVYEHAVEPPGPDVPSRCTSSRSDARTSSRCTCAGIRSCGCGCTGDGGTVTPQIGRRGKCFRPWTATSPSDAGPADELRASRRDRHSPSGAERAVGHFQSRCGLLALELRGLHEARAPAVRFLRRDRRR